MNKWLLLLLLFLCWMAAGIAFVAPSARQEQALASKPQDVKRIVSLAPNLTEILFALGLDEEIVGVTLHCNYPPAAIEKANKMGYWQPNIEAVIAAKPDLIVTLEFPQQKDAARRLARLGYNCLTVNIEKVSELYEAIDRIGEAAGKTTRAMELASSLRSKLGDLSSLLDKGEKPRVLWVMQRNPLRVAGRDTFVNEIIEFAGGQNAIGRTVHQFPPIGSEQVIAGAPEVIIEPTMTGESTAEQHKQALAYWSRFENVPAVANKRIHVIAGDTVCRLGPRLYEGVEMVARCLKPQVFTD